MDHWLEAAAAQAVRHDGVDAVILFGSRARGETRKDSDWDICLVGTHEPDNVETAMLPLGYETDGDRVDILWRDRAELLDDTSAGTVWAAVVQDGQVIAGDETILTSIEITPMKRTDIVQALGVSIEKIEASIDNARREQTAEGYRKALINVAGTATSAAAAEHLSRALLGLLGAQPGSGHNVETNAKILETAAEKADTPERATTLRAVANALRNTNGNTHKAHGGAYRNYHEPRPQWEHRIAKVAETYAAVIRGAMHANGPLAGLGNGPDRERIQDVLREVASTGVQTGKAVNEAGIHHLAVDTRRALSTWTEQWDAAVAMTAANPTA